MSFFDEKNANTMVRIADALEDIAGALVLAADRYVNGPGGNTPVGPVSVTVATQHTMASSDSYETAVGRLVDMPNDIPPEPAKDTTPVTKAEIVAALNLHARLHGIESSKKILAGFAPKLDQVPEDQYPDLLAMLKVAP